MFNDLNPFSARSPRPRWLPSITFADSLQKPGGACPGTCQAEPFLPILRVHSEVCLGAATLGSTQRACMCALTCHLGGHDLGQVI